MSAATDYLGIIWKNWKRSGLIIYVLILFVVVGNLYRLCLERFVVSSVVRRLNSLAPEGVDAKLCVFCKFELRAGRFLRF